MENREYIYADGTPVQQGVCIMPDHFEGEFIVRVRSLQPVSAETLRNVIQGRYEVTEATKTGERCVVKGKPPEDAAGPAVNLDAERRAETRALRAMQ